MSEHGYREHEDEETAGMRFAFWAWALIVAGGLATMIVLPLLGR